MMGERVGLRVCDILKLGAAVTDLVGLPLVLGAAVGDCVGNFLVPSPPPPGGAAVEETIKKSLNV